MFSADVPMSVKRSRDLFPVGSPVLSLLAFIFGYGATTDDATSGLLAIIKISLSSSKFLIFDAQCFVLTSL